MFCSKCGNKISEQSTYCMYCGKKLIDIDEVVLPDFDYQKQKKIIRESEINCLTDLIKYFSAKTNSFNEYVFIYENIDKHSNRNNYSLLVWGCIITSIFTFGLINEFSGGDKSFISFCIASILIGIVMIIGGISIIINNKSKCLLFNNRYKELKNELYNYYLSFPNCPIGIEYCNPEILELILIEIQSGRADTIKESIINITNDAKHDELINALSKIECVIIE